MINTQKILEVVNLEKVITGLILEADERFPDWRGEGKEQWVVDFSLRYLEQFDNALPVVGIYLDLPVCDVLESAVVRKVVKVLFDGMEKKVPAKKSKVKANVKD